MSITLDEALRALAGYEPGMTHRVNDYRCHFCRAVGGRSTWPVYRFDHDENCIVKRAIAECHSECQK